MNTNTTQLYDPPVVGGDCLAWCSKCKMELAHIIMSMVDRRPAKVICKTCRAQHNFKRQPGSGNALLRSSRPSPSRKTTARTAVIKVAELWEKKMAEKKSAPMRPYNTQQSFTAGEVIQHPNFGVGLVEEVRGNGKITVLFKEDEKILVHGLVKPG